MVYSGYHFRDLEVRSRIGTTWDRRNWSGVWQTSPQTRKESSWGFLSTNTLPSRRGDLRRRSGSNRKFSGRRTLRWRNRALGPVSNKEKREKHIVSWEGKRRSNNCFQKDYDNYLLTRTRLRGRGFMPTLKDTINLKPGIKCLRANCYKILNH